MNWWQLAACAGKPTVWWYPARLDSLEANVARALCRRCPVRNDCLDEALTTESDHAYGIRAGLSPDQRRGLPHLEPAHAQHVSTVVELSGRRAWPRAERSPVEFSL